MLFDIGMYTDLMTGDLPAAQIEPVLFIH